jgi:hypothetical protein
MNEENIKNLARLTIRFKDLKPNGYKGEFNMGVWCGEKGEEDFIEDDISPFYSISRFKECGTCGCFLGHGPYLGVGEVTLGLSWDRYCRETFGFDSARTKYNWLFNYNWDSDKEFTAKRAAYALEVGFPERDSFDASHNATPEAFEKYEPNWEKIRQMAE